ncbi:MAG: hypothetical protein KC431_20805 [Myxococcales bacterium]|nr:hypothetical protein [Myxococcales bacterium]
MEPQAARALRVLLEHDLKNNIFAMESCLERVNDPAVRNELALAISIFQFSTRSMINIICSLSDTSSVNAVFSQLYIDRFFGYKQDRVIVENDGLMPHHPVSATFCIAAAELIRNGLENGVGPLRIICRAQEIVFENEVSEPALQRLMEGDGVRPGVGLDQVRAQLSAESPPWSLELVHDGDVFRAKLTPMEES